MSAAFASFSVGAAPATTPMAVPGQRGIGVVDSRAAESAETNLPRRILMTADTVGGVWTYAQELARGLIAEGVDVMLATMGAPLRPEQRAAADSLGPHLHVRESAWKLEWMDEPWSDVAAAGEWLLKLADEFAPDLVHLNGYAHADLPWNAPTIVVAHSCVYSWWRAVRHAAPPPSWRRYHAAVSAALRTAALVVAPSHAMLDALRVNYGEFAARSQVIHNGRSPIATTHLPHGETSEKLHRILSVGRLWDEAKNAATLAGVASGLPWPVRLAGDIHGPDGVVKRLDNVELLGVCPPAALAEEYARAALYVLPARYEPFGLSVLEAAQAGCALVLGDISSLRELWDGAAVFVPPNDPHTLRAELAELIRQPDRRAALGQAALQRAHRYSFDRMIEGYLTAYASLLSPLQTQREVRSALSA